MYTNVVLLIGYHGEITKKWAFRSETIIVLSDYIIDNPTPDKYFSSFVDFVQFVKMENVVGMVMAQKKGNIYVKHNDDGPISNSVKSKMLQKQYTAMSATATANTDYLTLRNVSKMLVAGK